MATNTICATSLNNAHVRAPFMAVAIGLVSLAHSATAQCMEWSPAFSPGTPLGNVVNAFLVHDDGSGPALYLGGNFGNHIRRFRNGVWSDLGPGTNDEVACLTSFDPGTGSKLYVGGWFTQVGAAPIQGVAQWDGAGWSALTPPLTLGLFGVVDAMKAFDDGTGPALYIGGTIDPPRYLVRWNASSHTLTEIMTDGGVSALEVWNDGTGDALYVAGYFTQVGGVPANHLARWNGTVWQAADAGFPISNTAAVTFGKFDDGTGLALYAGLGQAPGLMRWDGSSWSVVGGGTSHAVKGLQVFDDGSGPALYAAGGFDTAGSIPAHRIARWDGTNWSQLGRGLWGPVGAQDDARCLAIWDDGYGGGPDLMVGGAFRTAGSLPSNHFAAWRGCNTDINSFCAGDGTVRNCPCSNQGAPGFGCAWSASAQGSWLVWNGATNPETLVLTAYSMPTTGTSLFLKGDQVDTSGVPFGDGLRCIDGSLVRLGIKQNSGGSAQYPDVGDAPLSVRGGTPPGSGLVAYYQTYFRNAANFCTSATFNVTNGVRVVW